VYTVIPSKTLATSLVGDRGLVLDPLGLTSWLEEIPMARRYLIDKILPARQVHLIGGPSGIGKTRWIVYLLKDWIVGNPILGFGSHPEPVMYFATDRNEESLEDTFEPFKINGSFRWQSLLNSNETIEQIIKANPDVRLFIFDPIMLFVPGFKYIDYGTVATFLRKLTAHCVKYDVTILGVVHTTKAKENALLVNPRERLLGSAAWGAYAETLFILGCDNLNTPEEAQIRNVHVLPRNAAEFRIFWKFDSEGIPIPTSNPADIEERYQAFIEAIPAGVTYNTQALLEIAKKLGISRSSCYEYLKRGVKDMNLEKVREGFYRRVLYQITVTE
jgi:hypothetical protein